MKQDEMQHDFEEWQVRKENLFDQTLDNSLSSNTAYAIELHFLFSVWSLLSNIYTIMIFKIIFIIFKILDSNYRVSILRYKDKVVRTECKHFILDKVK